MSLTWNYWTKHFINVCCRTSVLGGAAFDIVLCIAVLDARIRSAQDPQEEGILLLIREAVTDIMTSVLNQAVKVPCSFLFYLPIPFCFCNATCQFITPTRPTSPHQVSSRLAISFLMRLSPHAFPTLRLPAPPIAGWNHLGRRGGGSRAPPAGRGRRGLGDGRGRGGGGGRG